MRARPLAFVGTVFVRLACTALFFAALALLATGSANAQAVTPEPTVAATAATVGVASHTVEYGTLGGMTVSDGSSIPAPAAQGCGGECSAACPQLCECYEPCWTVRAGAIYLDRSRPRPTELVRSDFPPAGATLLNARELDPGVAWGAEVSAIRHQFLGTVWDLEGRYFGVDGWSATTDPVFSPSGSVIPFVTPLGNTTFPSNVSSSFQSKLSSVEVNARRQVRDWLQILVGIRYMDLDENGLSIFQDIGPALNLASTRITADNQMWGFQLGADARIFTWDTFSIELLGKAGIYSNHATNNVVQTQTAIPLIRSCGAERNHTAFVGELGLTGCYQLSRSWAFRVGYQVLWIEGVALATEQVGVSDPVLGVGTVNTDGSPVYHGGFIGLEYRR